MTKHTSRPSGAMLSVGLFALVAFAPGELRGQLPLTFADESAFRLPNPNETRLDGITYGATTADIDEDGDLDVFAVGPSGRSLLVNNGSGVFTDETELRISGNNTAFGEDPKFADFDQDGDQDIFIASNARIARLLVNQGHDQGGELGFFVEEIIRLNENVPIQPEEPVPTQGVDAKDVDNDGDVDIILANARADVRDSPLNQNLLLINQGGIQGRQPGTFVDETAARLPADTSVSFDAEFCDVDGDEDHDIVVANLIIPGKGGLNNIWINQGGMQGGTLGFFLDESRPRLPAVNWSSTYVVCGDVDNDEDLDIVVANFGQSQLFVNLGGLSGGTEGIFGVLTSTRLPFDDDETTSVCLKDLDSDGDLDAYVANGSINPQQDRLWLNNGAGFFSDVTEEALPIRNDRSMPTEMADFNGDTLVDIYVTGGGRDLGGSPRPEMDRVLINQLPPCGDGLLDNGQECDDGNMLDGDGCSRTCKIELCYQCIGEPSACGPPTTCRAARRSLLLIKDKTPDSKDKLIWKWNRGEATSQADFGEPTTTTDYRLCLFGNDSLVADVTVPAHRFLWAAISTKGHKYKDFAASEDGAQTILLKGSDQDKSKILVKGKGANLPDPTLPLELPVTVQLANSDTDVCWGSTFTEGDISKNESGQFKAKQ